MGTDGWTVNWLMLALAALNILVMALPWGSRPTVWAWLFAGLFALAAVASSAYDYRLFAVLNLTAVACLGAHLRRVWPNRASDA